MATNWALASNGSSATATNNFTGYEPSKAIDGNNATTYHSSTQSPITLEINLGTTRSINQIVLKTLRTDSPGYDFGYSLDYWNGSAWVNIVTGQATTNGTGLDYTQNFSAVNASKVRLVTTGSKYTTVNEFQINGDPPDTTAPSDVTGLTATKFSNSRVDINSNSATDNVAVTGYQTQRRIDGGSWVTLTPTTKAFSDTEDFPTTPGTYSFEYRRKAFDAAGNYSANWSSITSPVSIVVTIPPPSASFTMSKILAVVGETIVLTDTSSGVVSSRQWKLDGVNLATSSPYSLDTSDLEPGTYPIRLDVENSGGSDFDEQNITIIAFNPYHNGFELLQNIPCLQAKPSISFQKFKHSLGDGHRKTALYGSNTGLKKWSLTYRTLANVGNETYSINGVAMSPAEYLWDFYCRWQVSGEPFIMTCPLNGQYYLADFLDEELTYERLAAQLWSTGIQLIQVRQDNDFVFKPALWGNILEYRADSLSLADNASVSSWTEANGGASLTVSGGATFQTNEQFGLPIIRLDGTDDFISLSGTNTIYHVFMLLKITEATFGGNDGLFGDADTNIVSGVSGDDVFNTGDDAPVNQYGIVWFTMEGGQSLTTIQIGKKQAVSGTFLKADIAHIVLAKEQKSQTECLEMVEYIATKWNCFKVFKVNL